MHAADEIRNLLVRYGELVDAKDTDGVAELLGHAVIRVGKQGVIEGREKIFELYQALGVGGEARSWPRTKHVVTNVHLEIEEIAGRAEARSSWTVLEATERGAPPTVVLAGRYLDRFEQVDGAWRFAERRFVHDLGRPVVTT